MRVTRIVMSLIVLVMSVAVTVHAEPAPPAEQFYRDSIERKMNRCEQKLRLLQSKSENLKEEGENALQQLNFYRDNKEELVQEMVRRNVGSSQRKVEYFLIKAFNESGETVLSENR